MKETLSIETERMDDIPLLISHMQRMKLSELLDKHIPTHGHHKGLSVGELSVVWLAHILSQADHRMNRVREWGSRRLETLRGCGMERLGLQDLTDDRLADVLRLLSDDVHWHAFEQELMGCLLRVYDLQAACVRIDTPRLAAILTSTSRDCCSWATVKIIVPICLSSNWCWRAWTRWGCRWSPISGEHADDPVYLPIVARVRTGLQQQGLLYVPRIAQRVRLCVIVTSSRVASSKPEKGNKERLGLEREKDSTR